MTSFLWFLSLLISNLAAANTNESLGIFHGQPTEWESRPFMASLRFNEHDHGGHCCGASIISVEPPVLLTTASCVDPNAPFPCNREVKIGCDSGNCLGDQAETYHIDEIIAHPLHSQFPLLRYDLAILKLRTLNNKIDRPENVTAVEMQQGLYPLFIINAAFLCIKCGMIHDQHLGVPCCELDHPLTVIGYGQEAWGNAGDRLLEGQEEYLTNEICRNMTNTRDFDDEVSVLCFMDVYNENFNTKTSVCLGDEGGPVLSEGFGHTYLVGVISFYSSYVSPSNCMGWYPQGAANVGALYDWIRQNM